ncbi:hypothetical protein EKH80_15445, partial [Dyella choica]
SLNLDFFMTPPGGKDARKFYFPHVQDLGELTEAPRQLSGFVQTDDTYLGGEINDGKPGRGSENKQAFLIAVETDADLEHPVHAIMEPIRRFGDDGIKDWQARHLAPQAEAVSATACIASAASPMPGMRTRCWKLRAGARPVTCAAHAGSTWSWTTSIERPVGVSRHPAEQVRAALFGRGRLSFQSTISLARDAASTGASDDALRASAKADFAHGEQLSRLRFEANQVDLRPAVLQAMSTRYAARTLETPVAEVAISQR